MLHIHNIHNIEIVYCYSNVTKIIIAEKISFNSYYYHYSNLSILNF